jgi:c-di-GMP-binding flagellar brake protein YcgR
VEAAAEEDVDQVDYHSGMDVDVQLSFPDGLRFFTTKVRSIDHISYGGSLRLAWPVEGTRVQRREHVRIRAVKGAEVWYREEESRKLKRLKGFTTDISAGGVRVRVPEALPDETQVELELDIPVPGARTLHGRVVRSGIIGKEKKPEAYWLGIEFVGVGQVLRKALTQYVFDLEREQIRTALE